MATHTISKWHKCCPDYDLQVRVAKHFKSLITYFKLAVNHKFYTCTYKSASVR